MMLECTPNQCWPVGPYSLKSAGIVKHAFTSFFERYSVSCALTFHLNTFLFIDPFIYCDLFSLAPQLTQADGRSTPQESIPPSIDLAPAPEEYSRPPMSSCNSSSSNAHHSSSKAQTIVATHHSSGGINSQRQVAQRAESMTMQVLSKKEIAARKNQVGRYRGSF